MFGRSTNLAFEANAAAGRVVAALLLATAATGECAGTEDCALRVTTACFAAGVIANSAPRASPVLPSTMPTAEAAATAARLRVPIFRRENAPDRRSSVGRLNNASPPMDAHRGSRGANAL